jgi:hypothetical protein
MNSKRTVASVLLITSTLTISAEPASARRKPVTSLPAGLYCRNLKARGYSYGEAVQYWRYWDEPDNMDADLNGIPCETVYSAAEVRRYFG